MIWPAQLAAPGYIADLNDSANNQTVSFSNTDCLLPHEVVVDQDHIFVVCEGDRQAFLPGSVVMLDASYNVVTRTEVGVYPDSLRIVKGGS